MATLREAAHINKKYKLHSHRLFKRKKITRSQNARKSSMTRLSQKNRIKNAVYHHRLFKLLPIDERSLPLFGVLALAADLDCAQRRGK